MLNKDFTYSVVWNCFLIITGTLIYVVGLKGIADPHSFVPGGLFGLSFYLYYLSDWMNPGIIFAILNVPLFVLGKFFISKRFLAYSFLAMAVSSISYSLIEVDLGIVNQLYAAVTCGVLVGIGSGIVLRSLGSSGGLDIVAIILYQKFNVGVGKFYIAFNILLYSLSFATMNTDLVIASIISVFVTSVCMDYALSMFNQRKVVLVVTEKPDCISREIIEKLKISSTFINGEGAYSKRAKKVLMTVINNIQLKRLEEIVFTKDEEALFIVENTFNVIGASFSKRKIY
ncbi:MAG: YitT family protein [Desulfobacterales bacterium]|nr:YitT family protein [Desulfobacterales bacterium]